MRSRSRPSQTIIAFYIENSETLTLKIVEQKRAFSSIDSAGGVLLHVQVMFCMQALSFKKDHAVLRVSFLPIQSIRRHLKSLVLKGIF